MEPPQLFPVMYGLRSYFLMRAEHRTAGEIAEKLSELAEKEQDPSLLLEAYEAMGTTLFYVGDLKSAHKMLEMGIDIYDSEQHSVHAFLYGQDPGVACMSYSAITLWSQGYPDEAIKRSQDAIALARQVAHPFSLALALDFAALLNALRREGKSALDYATEAVEISSKHSFPVWQAVGMILSGWAMAERGEAQAGLTRMHEGLDSWQATGATLGRPFFLALLAEAMQWGGQTEQALGVIKEALGAVEASGEKVHESELHRLHGELLHLLGRELDDIVGAFQQAIDVSRRQGAKTMELRAAFRAAQILKDLGEQGWARNVLQKLFDDIGTIEETADLKEARALLEELDGNQR